MQRKTLNKSFISSWDGMNSLQKEWFIFLLQNGTTFLILIYVNNDPKLRYERDRKSWLQIPFSYSSSRNMWTASWYFVFKLRIKQNLKRRSASSFQKILSTLIRPAFKYFKANQGENLVGIDSILWIIMAKLPSLTYLSVGWNKITMR